MNAPRDLLAPFAAGVAGAGAVVLLVWGAVEVAAWFAELLARALVALLVIGYGFTPVMDTPAPGIFPTA